jgi:hypothetical protein
MGATSSEEEVRDSANKAWLLNTTEANERTLGEVLLRLEVIERELANAVKRRDSVDIGTPAKGGNLKCYFDALGDPAENDHAIEEAKRVLAKAGGTLGGA